MKRIIYILAALFLFSGCESFLDTESYIKKNTSNFPGTQDDAEQMITGIYASMNDLIATPEQHPFFMYEMSGDDRFGGGSTSNYTAQSLDRLMNPSVSFLQDLWRLRYAGIFRANNAIETMDNVTGWTTPGKREQLLAEAHFLRAFFYFDLVQVFGQAPLVLQIDPQNLPKSPADAIYAQIASDLKQAIALFPATPFPNYGPGHASKWAAEALMGRVYLFYTGFYKKSALPLADGGTVSKQEVVAWLEDCINNSGHALVSDQRNIWPYTNPYTAANYKYATDNKLVWEGDGCKETIFALKFSNTGASGYYNRIVEYFGMRLSGANNFPFIPQGYSNGQVNSKLWDDWTSDPDYAGDYRLRGSICSEVEEIPKYAGDKSKEVEKCRYWAKKYLGVGAYEGNTLILSFAYFYGGLNNRQYGLTSDLILIRMADVYLMHSELTETPTYMNKVRERAKLPPYGSYSLQALKKERRYELCFEASRWNDLRRWGDVQQIVTNQEGIPITNRGVKGTYTFGKFNFMDRYNQTSGGFWKIPEAQVTLSEGVLEQNPGWESAYDFIALPYYSN